MELQGIEILLTIRAKEQQKYNEQDCLLPQRF